MGSSSAEVGRELARLDRRIREVESNRVFRYVSLEGDSIPVYDEEGELRQVIGLQEDGTYTNVDYNGPPPPTPSTPSLVVAWGALVVVWDGLTASGEPWPLNFSHVEVHMSPLPGFIADDLTQVGVFTSTRGGTLTVGGLDPSRPYYACLVAVNTARKESPQSPQVAEQPRSAVSDGDLQAVKDEVSAAVTAVTNRRRTFFGPAEPPPPATGFQDGDVWYKEETPGAFSLWRWSEPAGAWVAAQFGGPALAVDSVDARVVTTDAIQSRHIGTDVVVTRHLGAESVTADQVALRSLTGDRLAGVIVVGTKVSAGALDDEGNIVGQHTDLGIRGLENIAVDGTNRVAFIPNDPAERAFLKAALDTEEMRVSGLTMLGQDNSLSTGAKLRLTSGVLPPTEAPQIRPGYTKVELAAEQASPWSTRFGDPLTTSSLNPASITGLGWHANNLLWCVAQQKGNGVRVWLYQPDGSHLLTPASTGADPRPYAIDLIGVTDVTSVFALPDALTPDSLSYFYRRNDLWWVRVRNSAGKYVDNKIPDNHVINPSRPPVLGWDAPADAYFLAQYDGDRARFSTLAVNDTDNGTATIVSTRFGVAGTGRKSPPVGATAGYQVDGVTRLYTILGSGGPNVQVIDSAGRLLTDLVFKTDGVMAGFGHDGANFWSVDTTGVLTKYENWSWASGGETFYAAHTWYDSGRGNGIPHETKLGRVASTQAVKRAQLHVVVPRVPDQGGVDDPDRFRLYLARADATPGMSSFRRVAEAGSAAAATHVIVFGDPTSVETPPPDPNPSDFPSGGGPAAIDVSTLDSSGRPKFEVDAAGGGRWPRLVPVGVPFLWTGARTLPPEGWVFCDVPGATLSRTQYPELAALYWDGSNYIYGNGNGTTTFALPCIPPLTEVSLQSSTAFSAASGWAVNEQAFWRDGRLAQVRLVIQRTGAAIASNATGDITNVVMGTISAGWRPVLNTGLVVANGPVSNTLIEQSTGELNLTALGPGNSFPQNETLQLTGTYLLAADVNPRVRTILYPGSS